MYLFRSSQIDQKPDPSFKKYFDWPIYKDPKGTIKTRTVQVERRTLPSSDTSRSYFKPSKKKKRSTLKNLKTQKVTDEDFRLLESFLSEILPASKSQHIPLKNKDQVIFLMSIVNMIDFILNAGSIFKTSGTSATGKIARRRKRSD